MEAASLIYTIGHSTRPLNEFIEILASLHIKKLIDVRTIPNSRFNPQFNKDHLSKILPQQNIIYHHLPGLGGLRHPEKIRSIKDGGMRLFADLPIICKPTILKNISKI